MCTKKAQDLERVFFGFDFRVVKPGIKKKFEWLSLIIMALRSQVLNTVTMFGVEIRATTS